MCGKRACKHTSNRLIFFVFSFTSWWRQSNCEKNFLLDPYLHHPQKIFYQLRYIKNQRRIWWVFWVEDGFFVMFCLGFFGFLLFTCFCLLVCGGGGVSLLSCFYFLFLCGWDLDSDSNIFVICLPVAFWSVFINIHFLKLGAKPNNAETSFPWFSFYVFK